MIERLRELARDHGTPTYVYDVDRLRAQVARLAAHLPPSVELLYSLKANPSLGLCEVLAGCGLGADVASAGELITALRAGFPPAHVFVSGPYKSPETLEHLRSVAPVAVLSIDSVSEFESLTVVHECSNPLVLRLQPDFPSSAVVNTGVGSHFGIPLAELHRCRQHSASRGIDIAGFHVFAGSQILDVNAIVRQLHGALELCLHAADMLQVAPRILNLGGEFGIPYRPGDQELALEPIGQALASVADQIPSTRIVLELGRYIVAQSGWYLTKVVAHSVRRGRRAVIVDGGVHQRADLCGLGLSDGAMPPLMLTQAMEQARPTDVLGCLCLPTDVLAEAALLPPLSLGDILVFPNAGAYGLSAAPNCFLGHPAPAEVAIEGATMHVLRDRQAAAALLDGQFHLRPLLTNRVTLDCSTVQGPAC